MMILGVDYHPSFQQMLFLWKRLASAVNGD